MNGRRQRCDLAHGAIAEVLAVHGHRGKQERHRRARHQVIETELGRHPLPPVTPPGRDLPGAFVESDRTCALVGRGTDRDRIEEARIERKADAREVDVPLQQGAQRRRVEDGVGSAHDRTTGQQRCQPAQSRAQHRAAIGPNDLVDVEIPPDPLEIDGTAAELAGMRGQHAAQDRTGRGAGQDTKRQRRRRRHPFRQCLEDADLVGAARAGPGQHEPDLGHRRRLCAVRQHIHSGGIHRGIIGAQIGPVLLLASAP